MIIGVDVATVQYSSFMKIVVLVILRVLKDLRIIISCFRYGIKGKLSVHRVNHLRMLVQ